MLAVSSQPIGEVGKLTPLQGPSVPVTVEPVIELDGKPPSSRGTRSCFVVTRGKPPPLGTLGPWGWGGAVGWVRGSWCQRDLEILGFVS